MAVLMPNSVFICIPKTGTQTVRRALLDANIPQVEIGTTELREVQPGLSQIRHASYWQISSFCEDRQVIASVRPTLEWYQSVWCHRKRTGEEGYGLIHTDNWRENFGDWIRWNCGAGLSHYGTFMCQVLDGADPILIETENLLDDLASALDASGEKFEPDLIIGAESRNQSTVRYKDQCRYSEELVRLVQGTEGCGTYPQRFMNEYGDRFAGQLLSGSSL